MNRRTAIQQTTERLARAGVPSAGAEAEHLLAEILGCSRPALWLDAQRELSAAETSRWEDWTRQRELRVPLQHLTHCAPFLEWTFRVSPAVLVPRPETEELAIRASGLLRTREGAATGRPQRVLDFATGSGCLAIALALRHPTAVVEALDISAAALEIARDNAQRLGCDARIHFHLGDGFAALRGGTEVPGAWFDGIVTNPPYIPSAEIADLEPEVRDHDPRLALDGGADGLEFYQRLAHEAAAWLVPGGWLLAEFGDGQGPAIRALFQHPAWESAICEPDLSGRERMLLVWRSAA